MIVYSWKLQPSEYQNELGGRFSGPFPVSAHRIRRSLAGASGGAGGKERTAGTTVGWIAPVALQNGLSRVQDR